MITTWWFKVGFWWFTRLENIKNKKLIYDPKFVYSHKPMSHHKIRFHLILLPKFLKFFFRTNWFRFNRNYWKDVKEGHIVWVGEMPEGIADSINNRDKYNFEKIPFWATDRFLFKYGCLELNWLYSEWCNIFLDIYACY